jgi:hypothetical protein
MKLTKSLVEINKNNIKDSLKKIDDHPNEFFFKLIEFAQLSLISYDMFHSGDYWDLMSQKEKDFLHDLKGYVTVFSLLESHYDQVSCIPPSEYFTINLLNNTKKEIFETYIYRAEEFIKLCDDFENNQ